MIIVGETYSVDGTSKDAYCRSKRPIDTSEFTDGNNAASSGVVDDKNFNQFYVYKTPGYGLMKYDTSAPALRFLCEDPSRFLVFKGICFCPLKYFHEGRHKILHDKKFFLKSPNKIDSHCLFLLALFLFEKNIIEPMSTVA
jgi:hypothetical protein